MKAYLNFNHVSDGRCKYVAYHSHCWMFGVDAVLVQWNDIVIFDAETTFIAEKRHCKCKTWHKKQNSMKNDAKFNQICIKISTYLCKI